MRGWMGGRRRRVAVERRDPFARRRRFFARRREAGRRRTVHRTNDVRISNDMFLIGGAAARDSALFRDSQLQSSRRDHRNIQRPQTATVSLEEAADMRVWDGEEETLRYRARELSSGFLNSNVNERNEHEKTTREPYVRHSGNEFGNEDDRHSAARSDRFDSWLRDAGIPGQARKRHLLPNPWRRTGDRWSHQEMRPENENKKRRLAQIDSFRASSNREVKRDPKQRFKAHTWDVRSESPDIHTERRYRTSHASHRNRHHEPGNSPYTRDNSLLEVEVCPSPAPRRESCSSDHGLREDGERLEYILPTKRSRHRALPNEHNSPARSVIYNVQRSESLPNAEKALFGDTVKRHRAFQGTRNLIGSLPPNKFPVILVDSESPLVTPPPRERFRSVLLDEELTPDSFRAELLDLEQRLFAVPDTSFDKSKRRGGIKFIAAEVGQYKSRNVGLSKNHCSLQEVSEVADVIEERGPHQLTAIPRDSTVPTDIEIVVSAVSNPFKTSTTPETQAN